MTVEERIERLEAEVAALRAEQRAEDFGLKYAFEAGVAYARNPRGGSTPGRQAANSHLRVVP